MKPSRLQPETVAIKHEIPSCDSLRKQQHAVQGVSKSILDVLVLFG